MLDKGGRVGDLKERDSLSSFTAIMGDGREISACRYNSFRCHVNSNAEIMKHADCLKVSPRETME